MRRESDNNVICHVRLWRARIGGPSSPEALAYCGRHSTAMPKTLGIGVSRRELLLRRHASRVTYDVLKLGYVVKRDSCTAWVCVPTKSSGHEGTLHDLHDSAVNNSVENEASSDQTRISPDFRVYVAIIPKLRNGVGVISCSRSGNQGKTIVTSPGNNIQVPGPEPNGNPARRTSPSRQKSLPSVSPVPRTRLCNITALSRTKGSRESGGYRDTKEDRAL
jgi:hypothetical protein